MSNFILSAFGDEIADDLKTQMDVLEQNGIRHIEIRCVDRKPIVRYSLHEVREIKKQLDDRGFGISAVGSPIGKISITDDFEPHLELFRNTIETANILETDYIRMFSFFIPENEGPDLYRDEVMKRWEKFKGAAKGSGLILLHENEKEIYGDNALRCLDILKSMNCSCVKAVFDPANFVQCNVETYPGAYELLKDYIAYVHIKDAVYGSRHVVPAGEGDGRIKEILSALYSSGFKGFLSIEPHLNDSLPGGGPELFSTACNALKKILFEVTGEEQR